MAESPTESGSPSSETPSQGPRGSKRRKSDDETPPESPQFRKIRVKKDADQDAAQLADEQEEAWWQQRRIIFEDLQVAKESRENSDQWAPEEHKLFDTIFLREHIPMLPRQWEADLGEARISDLTFRTTEEHPAVICSLSGKEFQASMAFLRLMELTGKASTTLQTRSHRTAARLIKRELDHFSNWAARDGEYSYVRIVPNLVIEAVSNDLEEDKITEYIQARMRTLARLQREFYKVDEDPEFWNIAQQESIDGQTNMDVMLMDKFSTPRGKRTNMDDTSSLSESTPDGLAKSLIEDQGEIVEAEVDTAAQPSPKTPTVEPAEVDETEKIIQEKEATCTRAKVDDTPETPPRAASPVEEGKYRRHPPVVYGLFIINARALVLSVDSAKGEDGHISFYTEADFELAGQGVWNALTIGTVVCRAREDLMSRMGDFEHGDDAETSDPDA